MANYFGRLALCLRQQNLKINVCGEMSVQLAIKFSLVPMLLALASFSARAELTMGDLKERRVIELLDRDTQRAKDQWQTIVMYVAGVRDTYQMNLYDRVLGIVGKDDAMGLLRQAEECTQVDAEVVLIRALAAANLPSDELRPSTSVSRWVTDWFKGNCRNLLRVIE